MSKDCVNNKKQTAVETWILWPIHIQKVERKQLIGKTLKETKLLVTERWKKYLRHYIAAFEGETNKNISNKVFNFDEMKSDFF